MASTTYPDASWRVLLIEDNPADARLIVESLAEAQPAPFELVQAQSLAAGLSLLAAGDVSLVLLDLTLPDSFGLETFEKAHAASPGVAIIVLSGRDDESLAIKTVHLGAQDYLVKGQVDARLLIRAMRYAIERQRAEQALQHERELFHTLLENLPDRIYFKDTQSRFIRISRGVAEQFKVKDPSEAIGKTDSDFFLPEHAQAALADEQEVMRTGQPILGKVEKETLPDGSITWALTSKLPLKDKEGRTIGNFGISRDITNLKKAEDALAAERNLLRSLIDNLPDLIYIKDAQGRFLLDNIGHRQFLGLNSQQDTLGLTVFDFFAPEIAKTFNQDDRTVLVSGRALVNREELITNRAGVNRWHSTTKVPLHNPEGHIVGLVGISRDIHQRKLAEEQLQAANSELAQSKAELEKVLTDLRKSHEDLKSAQFQLIQAEKMQSVGRLAAGVAHEVKNPLAVLGMGIEYMTKNLQSSDANVAIVLNDMTEALNRADGIILGLLDFSVPRALDLRPEDLSQVVEQSIILVRHELSGSIELVLDLDDRLPPIYIDRNKVKQLLVNVLTNALHAMSGGGTLTVRTSSRRIQNADVDSNSGSRLMDRFHEGDAAVMVEVLDTGPGIPVDKLPHVFDPFYTTKPTGKGTGLGLTVARKIVELHGGTIEIRNRPEGGAAVTMLFKV